MVDCLFQAKNGRSVEAAVAAGEIKSALLRPQNLADTKPSRDAGNVGGNGVDSAVGFSRLNPPGGRYGHSILTILTMLNWHLYCMHFPSCVVRIELNNPVHSSAGTNRTDDTYLLLLGQREHPNLAWNMHHLSMH